MSRPASEEVDRFRQLVASRLGLQFEEFKLNFLIDALQRRSEARKMTIPEYLSALESGVGATELSEIARELTVGETYFFRNEEQFHALREVAIPARMSAQASRRALRILSAGCSSGEEPYSMAMLVRETIPEPAGWSVAIVAIDINRAALQKAKAGRYTRWSLRATPDAMRDRWFRPHGRDFTLDGSIRDMVTFEERNLVDADPLFWSESRFDIVFCRNTIMYMTPEAMHALVERISRSLAAGGFLFLGHAETLRGISRDFHLLHTHGTFYYQRKDALMESTMAIDERVAAAATPLAEAFETADSWVETISRAAERVRRLTAAPAPERHRAGESAGAPWDMTGALEMLRTERYAEALSLIDALPEGSRRDPDVLILRAVLLTHRGELAAAEAVCRDLLTIDEMNAGAHYVLALCREGAGHRGEAIDHDQTASYLDPAFALPRLHLGLVEKKAGDREAARRDLSEALMLLEREDASRLLLFGGGFTREALIALCRAEVRACGASR